MWPKYFDFPNDARILEIGCAEADWIGPMKQARPDVIITGIDWRACERPAADNLVQGDVLTTRAFAPESFDAVVLISALEHIGLGHYGRPRDPADPNGDRKCMARAREWLRPKGLLYADVPWNPDPGYQVCGTECRIYDDKVLRVLGYPLHLAFRAWTTEHDTTTLIPRPDRKNGRFYYCASVWQKV